MQSTALSIWGEQSTAFSICSERSEAQGPLRDLAWASILRPFAGEEEEVWFVLLVEGEISESLQRSRLHPIPEENHVSDKSFEVNNIFKKEKEKENNLQSTALTNTCPHVHSIINHRTKHSWNQSKCPSTGEWINKTWPPHRMEYY